MAESGSNINVLMSDSEESPTYVNATIVGLLGEDIQITLGFVDLIKASQVIATQNQPTPVESPEEVAEKGGNFIKTIPAGKLIMSLSTAEMLIEQMQKMVADGRRLTGSKSNQEIENNG